MGMFFGEITLVIFKDYAREPDVRVRNFPFQLQKSIISIIQRPEAFVGHQIQNTMRLCWLFQATS